jgi:galactoside O-acetyltransferase
MTNPTIAPEYTHIEKGRVVLERFVIVGALSVILPGITVGEGSAVGAMSLLTRDMPEWKICGGVPARPLKDRSRNLLEHERRLTESQNV